ncbi:MAG: sigma-70 family RNA polymerase sigma factor [Gemmatimonas sp.]|nr:sigma-70 family RNA polymerase sigma factor [Gemmatimonas sp.]
MAREALEVLFRRYYHALRGVAGRYVACADDAEDVVQEVFARLYERPATWQRCREPQRYLFTAVRNQALKRRRRDRVAREAQRVLEGRLRPVGMSERVASPDEHLRATELIRAFLSSVDQLPPRYREAYLGHYWHGMTQAQVAQAMGISVRNRRDAGCSRQENASARPCRIHLIRPNELGVARSRGP